MTVRKDPWRAGNLRVGVVVASSFTWELFNELTWEVETLRHSEVSREGGEGKIKLWYGRGRGVLISPQ